MLWISGRQVIESGLHVEVPLFKIRDSKNVRNFLLISPWSFVEVFEMNLIARRRTEEERKEANMFEEIELERMMEKSEGGKKEGERKRKSGGGGGGGAEKARERDR